MNRETRAWSEETMLEGGTSLYPRRPVSLGSDALPSVKALCKSILFCKSEPVCAEFPGERQAALSRETQPSPLPAHCLSLRLCSLPGKLGVKKTHLRVIA